MLVRHLRAVLSDRLFCDVSVILVGVTVLKVVLAEFSELRMYGCFVGVSSVTVPVLYHRVDASVLLLYLFFFYQRVDMFCFCTNSLPACGCQCTVTISFFLPTC